MRVLTHFALWALGFVPPTTQTTDAERACLAGHARGRRRLVEIGVWHGVTTCHLRRAMASDALLLCIDPYPVGRLGFSAQRAIAAREVARVRNGSIQWIRKTGGVAGLDYAAAQLPKIDFAFIDGDHTYAGLREDWEAWRELVDFDGIVALHDSRSTADRAIEDGGSVIYTREVIAADRRFKLIDAVDSLSVLRRLPDGEQA
jgi:predicted O-methyltransferase YrrM